VPSGRRITGQCYLRDLYPTIGELTSVPVAPGVDGRSLAPLLRGEATEVYPFTVGYFRDVQRMIRTDRWKLIAYPKIGRWQLFDLRDDPAELDDLSMKPERQTDLAELRGKLIEWQRQNRDTVTLPALAKVNPPEPSRPTQ
ncbi:MAG TPA: sulfatase/phosphatase domain-containing protein, partial [Pirellulales bacterium]|nr:sulfatase/phosphatase domain-containing protein [Pirellulales bacterium]